MRKPHAKSKLKLLDPAIQERIADWCAQDTLESAVRRCASELSPPISTQVDSMSKFYDWWQKKQAEQARALTIKELFRRADANAQAVAAMLKETGASEDQIARADQLVFTLQASSAEDKALFIELEKLRLARETAAHKARMDVAKLKQKDTELDLATRRVTLLEQKVAEAQKALDDPKLDAATRAARIREILQK